MDHKELEAQDKAAMESVSHPHSYRFYEKRQGRIGDSTFDPEKLQFDRTKTLHGYEVKATETSYGPRQLMVLPCGCKGGVVCGHCCGVTFDRDCEDPETHFLAGGYILYIKSRGEACTEKHQSCVYIGAAPAEELVRSLTLMIRRRILNIGRGLT